VPTSAPSFAARPAGFIARFALGFVALYVLYGFVPDDVLRDQVFRWGLAAPAAAIVDLAAPTHGAHAAANVIASSRAMLEIVRGCEGAGVFFLLAAAMLAVPGALRARLAGAAIGLALVYGLNLARIVALYFIVAHGGAWFEVTHLYVAPLTLIAAVAAFFSWWSDGVAAGVDSARAAP
jgi:exosortase family protein XrtM